MPNRYIREGIIESEAVNMLSWQAEVFYRRLINRVDDFGRFTAHPALLRASLFPLQIEKVREADMSRLLLECEQAGLLYVYATNEKRFLVLNKWEKGRAAASHYPAPPDAITARLDGREYLGSGVHMGSRVGGVGGLGTAVPSLGARAPDLGTAALDSDSGTDSDSDSDPGTAVGPGTGAGGERNPEPPIEPPPGFPRTLAAAQAQAANVGCPAEFIEKTWSKALSRGGRDARDVPIRNWRAYLATEWSYERERMHKQNGSPRHPVHRPGVDRSAGTANEGKANDYCGLG